MESSDNVVAAFEMLLEEVETQVSLLGKDNAKAWKEWDFNQAGELVKSAEMITAFREEVLKLQQKWEALFPDKSSDADTQIEPIEKESVARNSHGRLKRGMRTREQDFRLPILNILARKGGSASMKIVLEELEKSMHGILKDVDYYSLPSDPDTIRWRNTAQWSRQALVNEGLLKNDSPRGTWEISEAGLAHLKNSK